MDLGDENLITVDSEFTAKSTRFIILLENYNICIVTLEGFSSSICMSTCRLQQARQ
jgi:hypothetical protein